MSWRRFDAAYWPSLSPDGDGAGGGGEGTGTEGTPPPAPAKGEKPGSSNANGGGEQPGGDQGFKPITTQEEFDKHLTHRLKTMRSSLAKEIRGELEAEAEEKRQQEAGQFKELADKRGTKIGELEADLKAARDALAEWEEIAAGEYTEALGQLPDAIKDFAPDDAADALTKRKWLTTKARPAAAKLSANGDGQRKPPGLKPKDPPSSKETGLDIEDSRRRLQESGLYRRM